MPRSDVVFERVARHLAAASSTPRELQARLRTYFPRAVVRERGLSHEPPVLYIYRDGRYEQPHDDGWWAAGGVPSITIDLASGRIAEASNGAETLLRAAGAELVGRPWTDLVGPEAMEVAHLTLAAVLELGEVTSVAVLRRSDNSELLLEFHAALRDGRIDVAYRPVPE